MVCRMDTGIHRQWYDNWSQCGRLLLHGERIGLVSYSFSSPQATLTYMARGIIGPILVAKGYAFGTPVSEDPKWSSYVSYSSLALTFASADHPSPRYWLLWPGVLCMIAVSFTGKPSQSSKTIDCLLYTQNLPASGVFSGLLVEQSG